MRFLKHTVMIFVCGCASSAMAQTETSSSTNSRTHARYAQTFGVTVEEAARRLDRRRDIGALNARLEQEQGDTFGGIYIEHTPSYRAVVRFTGDAAATLARYTQDPLFVPETSAVPVRELVQTQRTVYDLLKGLGLEAVSRVRVSTGRVEFFVADPSAVQSLVTAGTLSVPDYVTFG